MSCYFFFFFKQKTAYEMRISDWSSDVCSSDLGRAVVIAKADRGTAHDDLAIGRNADLAAGQWPANAAGTTPARPVDGNHRAAFGQAIALMHRDAERPGLLGQRRRHGGATHGDEAQAVGNADAADLRCHDEAL